METPSGLPSCRSDPGACSNHVSQGRLLVPPRWGTAGRTADAAGTWDAAAARRVAPPDPPDLVPPAHRIHRTSAAGACDAARAHNAARTAELVMPPDPPELVTPPELVMPLDLVPAELGMPPKTAALVMPPSRPSSQPA